LTYCIKKSRTFAGDLLDADVELVTVEKFMGHSDANTTDGYNWRGEETARAV
jgi:site-specific recombinase XerD